MFAVLVVKHYVGQRGGKRRITTAHVNIEVSIVVYVSEVEAHRHEDTIQIDIGGDILKLTVPEVSVQLQGFPFAGKPHVASRNFFDGKKVRGDKEVGLTVVVVIEEPSP